MEWETVWELACIVRFHAFPFIEDALKRRPIRMLFDMNVGDPKFKTLVKPCLEFNQFTKFCQILSHRKTKGPPRDVELIETLFWNEPNPTGACHILQILLRFPTNAHPAIWCTGTNLLSHAKTDEEKIAALLLLDAFASG